MSGSPDRLLDGQSRSAGSVSPAAGRLRVVAVQLGAASPDPAENLRIIVESVGGAAEHRADLALFPELATTHYFCGAQPRSFRHLAETLAGPTLEVVAEAARSARIAVALPFYERAGEDEYNSVVLFDADGNVVRFVDAAGRERSTVRKLHLPRSLDPDPFDERAHFKPGEYQGVAMLPPHRIGVIVCYDRRFPEVWRTLRSMGATLCLVPIAGSGGDSSDMFLCELRTRARENGVYVVAANRSGKEFIDGRVTQHHGDSCVIRPDGAVANHRSGEAGAGFVIADVDLEEVETVRRRLPYFEDLRRGVLAPTVSEEAVQ